MRILLATAAAIAPLTVAAGAHAQQVISTARTTPIATATATGTAPDSVRIASGGSVAVTSGAAVTLNSSHTVDIDNGGSVTMTNAADGATGVLANGGNSGSVLVGGAINITDSINQADYKDADSDGDLDGPFAAGTDRYGVRVVGATPLTGDVRIESGGAISVEGNQSGGVYVGAPLNGSLQNLGTITVLGDGSYGVRTVGDVSGNVDVLGAVTATGAGATAVSLEGDTGARSSTTPRAALPAIATAGPP